MSLGRWVFYLVVIFFLLVRKHGFLYVVNCRNSLLWMRQGGLERWKIRMMCGMRLVDRVSTDVLHDRVGVVVKTEDVIIWSHLWWYGHVIRGDISYQIREVEVEIRKKDQPRKLWEECVKKDLEQYSLRWEDAYNWKKWLERIKAKFLTLASLDNGIKTDVFVVFL